MGSPCLFLPCMPSILSAFCWVAREMFETLSTGKIVITVQQLWILLKPRAYSSFWAIILQNGDFKLSDVANNVRKLDRYLSFSYSSLAPNKEFYVTYTQKYNFYYQTFFLLEICFSCTYYEQITSIKMGRHRARLGENRQLPISWRSVLQKTAVFSTCSRSCARCWRKKLCVERMRNAIQGNYLKSVNNHSERRAKKQRPSFHTKVLPC